MTSFEKPVTWLARCPGCGALAAFTARPPDFNRRATLTIDCTCSPRDTAPTPDVRAEETT